MALTEKQYISWVQRSLNRLLGTTMKVDGTPTIIYRENVKEFQFGYARPQTGHMDSSDQDKMIKANHLTPEYVVWLQESFNTTGAGMGLTPDGIFGSKTKTALLSFQAYQEGLIDDGWVGAKTESELIKVVGIKPPGEITGITPKLPARKPRPKPVNPYDPLTPEQRYVRSINAIYYEALYRPSFYENSEFRKRMLCFTGKLKKQRGIDDNYITADKVTRYVRSPGYGYTDGVLPGQITSSAIKDIKSRLKWLSYEDRNDQEKLREIVIDIYYSIEWGLTRIANEKNVHGDTSNSAKALRNWGIKQQSNKDSILSCFK